MTFAQKIYRKRQKIHGIESHFCMKVFFWPWHQLERAIKRGYKKSCDKTVISKQLKHFNHRNSNKTFVNRGTWHNHIPGQSRRCGSAPWSAYNQMIFLVHLGCRSTPVQPQNEMTSVQFPVLTVGIFVPERIIWLFDTG